MWNNQTVKLIMSKGLAVLRDFPSNALVSNHAVIIREYSEKSMRKYELLNTHHFFPSILIKSFLGGMAKSFLSWFYENETTVFGANGKADIVFLSHLTNCEQLSDTDDPYFGSLPERLAGNKLSVATVFVNQSGVCIKKIPSQEVSLARSIIVLPRGTSFRNSGFILWQMIKESGSLIKNALKAGCKGERDYLLALAAAQLDHKTFDAFKLSSAVSEICGNLRPSLLIITFEGYSWERLACKLIHEKFPQVVVIGYQHAVITGGPRAINHKFGGGIDPDHIVCTGPYVKQRLVAEGDFRPKDLTIIGTPKTLAQNYLSCEKRMTQDQCILAVPEGVMSETLILGQALTELASQLPKMRCVLRLHPIISREKVLRICSKIRSAPENFSISSRTLECDIADSGWLIYRGSSVVLSAIASGARALFFDDTGRNIGDIIDADLSWRIKCHSINDLIVQIQKDLKSSKTLAETNKMDLAEAQKFIASYYSSFDVKSAIKLFTNYSPPN